MKKKRRLLTVPTGFDGLTPHEGTLATMLGRKLLAGATVATTALCLLLAVAMDKTPPAVLLLAKTKGLACGRCRTWDSRLASPAARLETRGGRRAPRQWGCRAYNFCMPLRRWQRLVTQCVFSSGAARALPAQRSFARPD